MSSILIVDDIKDNVVVLRAFLEAEGHSVDTADNGWEAIRKMREARPDLVLLDVMMPDMTGYEVVERVRQHQDLSDVPIVFVTAYLDVTETEAREMGANDFIRKPIDYDKLLSSVRAFCG